MLLKMIGIALMVLCAYAIGQLLSSEVERSLSCAGSLCDLLRYTREMIDSFSMSGPLILASCDEALLARCGYSGRERPTSFCELMQGCEIGDGECARIFGDFCRGFGKGYREEQLRSCERCLDMLSARTEQLIGEVSAKKKIIVSSALSGALMLAILLA